MRLRIFSSCGKRYLAIALTALLFGLLPAGCGPSREQVRLVQAYGMRYRPQADWRDAYDIFCHFGNRSAKDKNMFQVESASAALIGGNGELVRKQLLECHERTKTLFDKSGEFMATVSREDFKNFIGLPFERAMVDVYLGLTFYEKADYSNARIFFFNAILADHSTLEDMAQYRDDFRLAHFWLAKAYLRLDRPDQARIGFEKAQVRIPRPNEERENSYLYSNRQRNFDYWKRVERHSFEKAVQGEMPVKGAVDLSKQMYHHNEAPTILASATDENPVLLRAENGRGFFDPEFQRQVNLNLIIELGYAPQKILGGIQGEKAVIICPSYLARSVDVYIDGHLAGRGVKLLDTYHQAQTRGSGKKDTVQAIKGITKYILSNVPYVSNVAQYWDVSADIRRWALLPGEVHVFSVRVKPGLHTIDLRYYDINDNHLPRASATYSFIPIKSDKESLCILHSTNDWNNAYVPPPKTK